MLTPGQQTELDAALMEVNIATMLCTATKQNTDLKCGNCYIEYNPVSTALMLHQRCSTHAIIQYVRERR